MIGAWKRQAMDGMASLFDGGDQAAKASSEAEIENCMPDWPCWWSAIFWREPPVDEHGPEAKDDRA
jgi:hypothetical protein